MKNFSFAVSNFSNTSGNDLGNFNPSLFVTKGNFSTYLGVFVDVEIYIPKL